MSQLRLDAEESQTKVEELTTKIKVLEQETLSKEQEITSLQHKNGLLESEVEKLEALVKDLKVTADSDRDKVNASDAASRKLQLLEEEAEVADKTLRETNEKYVTRPVPEFLRCIEKYPISTKGDSSFLLLMLPFSRRLRQTDVKAGHFERKVQALEAERDQWEGKYEEMAKKHIALQKELDDLQIEISGM